jgi:hypothetical protein
LPETGLGHQEADEVVGEGQALVEVGLGPAVQSGVELARDLDHLGPRSPDQHLEQDLEALGAQLHAADDALAQGEEPGEGVADASQAGEQELHERARGA